MRMKALLLGLAFLFTPLRGVCAGELKNIHLKTSEMVALQCRAHKGGHNDTQPIWTRHGDQALVLSRLSPAEQRQMAVLVQGGSLVILNASVGHQGNYSCSERNGSGQSWFRLTVDATRTTKYDQICHVGNSCTLNCPDSQTPATSIQGIKERNITWHKVGDGSPVSEYFSSVEKNDQGDYTCTRYYQCLDRLCHMTFKLALVVQPNEQPAKSAAIISPRMGETFPVDLGSTVVVDCKAVTYSFFDNLFWLIEDVFVDNNESLPIFQNSTNESETQIKTSLVFRNVSEADLLKNYTCKLETASQPGRFVTITLEKKPAAPPPPCYLSLALGIIFTVLLMILVVIVCVKFKMTIVLFLRNTLGCHRRSSDGKTYDAFLMCYKSDTDAGLNELDKGFLKSVLEETFGYSLCLYDRDVLPGKAAANAVLDCIEQSRTVVLVPTSSDSCLESGLLSAIHAARVERRSRLIFIRTPAEQGPRSGSVPEALQLLAEAGDRVTWKGSSSMPLSSSFWKQLRYYLPALQDVKKTRLRSQRKHDVI